MFIIGKYSFSIIMRLVNIGHRYFEAQVICVEKAIKCHEIIRMLITLVSKSLPIFCKYTIFWKHKTVSSNYYYNSEHNLMNARSPLVFLYKILIYIPLSFLNITSQFWISIIIKLFLVSGQTILRYLFIYFALVLNAAWIETYLHF